MVLFNYSTRELTAKIVYYGPGLCGKTTNLQYIFDNLPGSVKGKMLSLATKTDRTLFFDFLPLDLGEIRGMKTRIQLYTVPGQVFYNETRRLVLKGADGVVFVADSQKQMTEANSDSYRNLEENLRVHSMKLPEMPLVVQYNKRDLPNLASIEEMNQAINRYNSPFYESVATTGIGVQDTLKAITKLVLLHLTKRYDARKPSEAVTSAVASGAGAVAGSSGQPSAARPQVGIPPSPSYASANTASSQEPIRLSSAAATAFEESTEAPVESVVELTEEIEEVETAAYDEEEPIELVDEVDEMEETLPITAFSGSTPYARAGAVEKEIEIDEGPDTAVEGPERDIAAFAGRSEAAASKVDTPSGAAIEISHVKEPSEAASAPDAMSSPRLVLGQPRTIHVPVEIEMGGTRRRFTLSIALRITDPSDSA